MEYTESNGLRMMSSSHLNWRIESTYHDNTGPDYYYLITVGDIADMYSCIYQDGILSISNLAYSSDFVLKFKVPNLDIASTIVLSFALGMKINLSGTIYSKL